MSVESDSAELSLTITASAILSSSTISTMVSSGRSSKPDSGMTISEPSSTSSIGAASSTVSNISKGSLTSAASSLEGMNTTLRWAGISLAAPLVTFTLLRASTSISLNTPIFFILTDSPFCNVADINEKNSRRKSSDCFLLSPVALESRVVSTGNVIFSFMIKDCGFFV